MEWMKLAAGFLDLRMKDGRSKKNELLWYQIDVGAYKSVKNNKKKGDERENLRAKESFNSYDLDVFENIALNPFI